MMASEKYLDWPIKKLKMELIAKGAITSGRKTQLIERLQAYDKNANFQEKPVQLPEPLEVDWPINGFRQLQKDHRIAFPKITKEQVEAYFLYRLAGDRQCRGDIKSLSKGQLMYESSRVQACSILFKDEIYLSGIVGAAMKKRVSYNYKIKLEKKTGDPLNSHCECPAGRGPHGTCKHIAAVLIMLQNFITSGNVNVEKSCTDNLMMFNKPKSTYSGSPVKAEKLPTKRKLADAYLSDPRPEKYRNNPGFNDHVRNIITNYCSQSSADISFRYMYGKADIQMAARDHDYCQLPFTEHWIDNSLQVDENKRETIAKETIGQSANIHWFNERSWRLTASRFGEICKATCRRNIKKLCESLSCRNINTSATLHGKKYETKTLKAFEMKYDVVTKKCGLFVCLEKPYLGASPDAVIDDESIVEVKCPFSGRNEIIKPGPHFKFLKYDSNGNISLKPSCNYFDQIQGQLYICNRKVCFFVVYTFCDLFVERIFLDSEYCSRCLIPKLDLFYKKYYRPCIASKL